MKVLLGALHLDVEVGIAAKTVRQTGLGGAQPVAVADDKVVDVLQEGVFQRADQLVEASRTGLFHRFKDELKWMKTEE